MTTQRSLREIALELLEMVEKNNLAVAREYITDGPTLDEFKKRLDLEICKYRQEIEQSPSAQREIEYERCEALFQAEEAEAQEAAKPEPEGGHCYTCGEFIVREELMRRGDDDEGVYTCEDCGAVNPSGEYDGNS